MPAVLTKNEIMRAIAENKAVLERYSVRRIGLFGSFVRGEETPDSDIDLLVTFRSKTFRNYMDLKFFFEDYFGRTVDLVTEEAVKQRLRERINDEVEYVQGYHSVS